MSWMKTLNYDWYTESFRRSEAWGVTVCDWKASNPE